VPTGEWKTTWGAVADDQTGTGNIGVAAGKSSEYEAAQEAIGKCESLGGGECQVTLAYNNQCVVIAAPSVEGKEVAGAPHTQGAETIEVATSLVLPKCSKRNSGLQCIVVYSACSLPVYESY
jgi:hypothetical protein